MPGDLTVKAAAGAGSGKVRMDPDDGAPSGFLGTPRVVGIIVLGSLAYLALVRKGWKSVLS